MTGLSFPIGEDDLHAYVDGRLPPDRVEAVERYLETNPVVAKQVVDWKSQRQELRDRLLGKASEPVPARLRIANVRALHRSRQVQRMRAIAASLMLIAVGGLGGWVAKSEWASPGSSSQGVMIADAISAYRTFVVEAAHPVEVRAAEQDHLVQWLSNRLGRSVKAPDLSSYGFRLMGGRVLPAADGVAAQLMYDDDRGTRLTVYLRNGEHGETAFRFVREGQVAAFYWADQGLGFAVSAAATEDRLKPIVRAVYSRR